MDTFGFTRKKYLSLSEQGRRTHLSGWLASVYQRLLTSRVTPEQFCRIHAQYRTITAWSGTSCPPVPAGSDNRARLAFISDAIHRLRIESGQFPRDYDLLDRVVTGDRAAPRQVRPDMDYQVALDGLRSLFNVGSIYRSCEAAGVRHLILGNCPGRENPRVRKTAMGTQHRLVEEKTTDLAQTLEAKKRQGFRIIALETLSDAVPCHQYPWPAKAVLLVGNEEYGIAPHVLSTRDDAVHIPLFGQKNSLNVANALSTVLFQAVFSRMAESPGDTGDHAPPPD